MRWALPTSCAGARAPTLCGGVGYRNDFPYFWLHSHPHVACCPPLINALIWPSRTYLDILTQKLRNCCPPSRATRCFGRCDTLDIICRATDIRVLMGSRGDLKRMLSLGGSSCRGFAPPPLIRPLLGPADASIYQLQLRVAANTSVCWPRCCAAA